MAKSRPAVQVGFGRDAVPQQMIDDPLEGRAVLFETRLLCSYERYSHHFGISEERQRVVDRAHCLPGSVPGNERAPARSLEGASIGNDENRPGGGNHYVLL